MKKKERESEVKRRENHRSAFVCVRVYFFSTTRSSRAREREKESTTEKLSVEGFEIKFFHSSPSTRQQQRRIRFMELPKEREREREQKRNEAFCSRGALLARCYSSLFLLSLLHIFPFESSFLLGEKQAEEDERLVLFYLVVVLVAEDGRKAEEREEE
jgi:hypothetical protein